MNDPFISPGDNINSKHDDVVRFGKMAKGALAERWQTPAGKKILTDWQSSGFDGNLLAHLTGKFYDHFDLRGIPLAGADLGGKNLRGIDFFAADLRNASVREADLSESYLSEADLRGADFSWAKMTNVFIDNAKFDEQTNFLGVNLNAVNFNLAYLIKEQAETQQRIAHLRRRHPYFAKFLAVTCDYGRSLMLWSLWVLAVVIIFGFLFGAVPGLITGVGIFDGMYFSFVTFTTLGYGDILPIGVIGKILVIMEVSLGYLMGGLLVAILAKRMLG